MKMKNYEKFSFYNPESEEDKLIVKLIYELTLAKDNFIDNNLKECTKPEIFTILYSGYLTFLAILLKSISAFIKNKNEIHKFLEVSQEIFDNYTQQILDDIG